MPENVRADQVPPDSDRIRPEVSPGGGAGDGRRAPAPRSDGSAEGDVDLDELEAQAADDFYHDRTAADSTQGTENGLDRR